MASDLPSDATHADVRRRKWHEKGTTRKRGVSARWMDACSASGAGSQGNAALTVQNETSTLLVSKLEHLIFSHVLKVLAHINKETCRKILLNWQDNTLL